MAEYIRLANATLSFAVASLLGGLAFSLGLFSVLVAGAELFTGNNLMVLDLLERRYGLGSLLKSWAVVYAGNFVGSLVLVALLVMAGYPSMGGSVVGTTMVTVAAGKCALPWATAFAHGVMCNILVCLAVWMSFAWRTVVDSLDHTFLVEEGLLAPATLEALEAEGFSITVLPFRTTAENLARYVAE